MIGCTAVSEEPRQNRIVITEADLESRTTRSSARSSDFLPPQVVKTLIIIAVVLVALAIAAAFYLRSATREDEGPIIDWGQQQSKKVR